MHLDTFPSRCVLIIYENNLMSICLRMSTTEIIKRCAPIGHTFLVLKAGPDSHSSAGVTCNPCESQILRTHMHILHATFSCNPSLPAT